jgi:hypothetical protein
MLDKKTFAIGVLSLSAVILLVANLLTPRNASATYETIQDNDYSMVTATALGGGDAVFVTEKRSGKMAMFVFDPNQKKLVPKVVTPIQTGFAKMPKK